MKKKKKMKPTSLHEDFGNAAIPVLQGAMQSAAEDQPKPERFVTDNSDAPKMKITDNQTGRSTIVSLFAYRNVIQALNDLFP